MTHRASARDAKPRVLDQPRATEAHSRPEDVTIVLVESKREDLSFGNGVAQYLGMPTAEMTGSPTRLGAAFFAPTTNIRALARSEEHVFLLLG